MLGQLFKCRVWVVCRNHMTSLVILDQRDPPTGFSELPEGAELYGYWRFVLRTVIYSLIGDETAADEFWGAFKEQQAGRTPFADLHDTVKEEQKPLNLKLYSAIVLSMKKHPKAMSLATKLQAKARFGCGRSALAVLDKHFGHEIAKLAR